MTRWLARMYQPAPGYVRQRLPLLVSLSGEVLHVARSDEDHTTRCGRPGLVLLGDDETSRSLVGKLRPCRVCCPGSL